MVLILYVGFSSEFMKEKKYKKCHISRCCILIMCNEVSMYNDVRCWNCKKFVDKTVVVVVVMTEWDLVLVRISSS